jgi:hypothetical protein
MGISLKQPEDLVWYVPEYGDNRIANPQDQARVLISPMSAMELNRFQAGIAAGNKKQALKRAQALIERVVSEKVQEAINFTVETPDGVVQPTNGPDLVAALRTVAAPGKELIDDIFEAIKDQSQAEDGILKKSDSRCESSPAETTPSYREAAPGVVDPATQTSPTKNVGGSGTATGEATQTNSTTRHTAPTVAHGPN